MRQIEILIENEDNGKKKQMAASKFKTMFSLLNLKFVFWLIANSENKFNKNEIRL